MIFRRTHCLKTLIGFCESFCNNLKGRCRTNNRNDLNYWTVHKGFSNHPVVSPRYAAACVVEHGGGGSRAAAPVVRDVMTEVLLRDPALKTALLASNEQAAGAAKERKR